MDKLDEMRESVEGHIERNIEAQIRILAADRDALSELKASIQAQNEELKQTMEYQRLDYMQTQAKALLDAIQQQEDSIKKIAFNLYGINHNKQPHPAVQIKTFTIPVYDDDVMKAWAIDHKHPAMLNLNRAAANKVAKGPTAPSFVTILEEDRAQIKSDLSDYLLTV